MKVSTFWNDSKKQIIDRLVSEIHKNLVDLSEKFKYKMKLKYQDDGVINITLEVIDETE
tara:strand:+ start:3930 stop:4106 length:177 start_codon:yes stop_codon:yes gene_type:complete